MPTRRFCALLVLALVLYFFANQTQVGWLYIMVGLLFGVMFIAYRLNRKGSEGVNVDISLPGPDRQLWEGDLVTWEARFSSIAGHGSYQYQIGLENPLEDPQSEAAVRYWLLPHISEDGISLKEETVLYKRGLHHFETGWCITRFPFGLFTRGREIGDPNQMPALLVYPELRELDQFLLLDEKQRQEAIRPKIGYSHEVLSVRPYRHGDSPRHIHWRSTARAGQLISKEFAADADQGVTLWIEPNVPLYLYGEKEVGDSDRDWEDRFSLFQRIKANPFELGVKVAASIGEYALRMRYPLFLADEDGPRGAVSADLLWPYLARIEPHYLESDEDEILPEPARISPSHLIYLIPFPTEMAIRRAIALKETRRQLTVILIDQGSFPMVNELFETVPAAEKMAGELIANQIETIVIGNNEDWIEKLSA
ncbi:MAG: DUF58 domain-containing protein [Chloroflexota bacterium]